VKVSSETSSLSLPGSFSWGEPSSTPSAITSSPSPSFFSVYLWIWQDWNFFLAFILFPILVLLVHFLIITSWLWYKNPSIPLIAKKPPR
jgi:hypothetical protein